MPKKPISHVDLANDKDFYQQSFLNFYEAIYWINSEGNVLISNSTFSHRLGYGIDELINIPIQSICDSDLLKNFQGLWSDLKKNKKLTFKGNHLHKSGHIYPVEITWHYFIFKENELASAWVRDISDQILEEDNLRLANTRLEGLLKESEERFRDLFEEAPIAYVHEGLDSHFLKANKAALRILGVRPDQVPYMYGKNMAPNTPEAQKRMKEAFESVGRGTDTSGVILELLNQENGKPIFIQWWSNPDKGGNFTRTMFIDITDKVLMEQEQAKLKAQNQYLQEEIKLNHNFEKIISKNKNFHKVLQRIEQVASTDATVLILGESGTGKELLARAVHNISPRGNRPLIKINCANLSAELIESELFGHEKGAFTGAIERKIGRFELADKGTIFLDEIGELPLLLQSKLLRVLQEGEFERLGNSKTINVDVRLIAATNRNLEDAISRKEFREDLFYRINVFPIYSPPLRERKEDIPLLVKHFVQKYQNKMGRVIRNIPDEVIAKLMEYDWPGNIRELENIVERALIVTLGETLEDGDWVPHPKVEINRKIDTKPSLSKLNEVERDHILDTLKKTHWKVSGEKGAAKILGLNPTTLESKMKKLGIERGKDL